MLAPKDRTLLLEALRPPPGYRLDIAVSTTYTLDLMALMVAPLAFTFFDWEDKEGEPTGDPNALLEAIRRHMDRIYVFCQAGQIAVPNTYKLLFSYLENSVHEVLPKNKNGVFHPKVWVLRYVADGEPNQYRLLCSSRNLTFDKSWDTLLVLNGELSNKVNKSNKPLAKFVRALPDLAVNKISVTKKNEILELAKEINHIEFQLPKNIDSVDFWPLGLAKDEKSWPFPKHADRALIISPFLAAGGLSRLNIASKQTLVSRVDSLDKISSHNLDDYEVMVLSNGAELDLDEVNDNREDASIDLSGLHAKLFVYDVNGFGHLWTGSANATNAAFHSNVEFLVEMRGKSHLMGVEAILCPQQKGVSVLRDLLDDYEPPTEDKADKVEQSLDHLLNNIKQ